MVFSSLSVRDCISASQTYHRWRVIALDAQNLWSEFDCDAYSDLMVCELLGRSKSWPLRITLDSPSALVEETLLRHMHHVQDLRFAGGIYTLSALLAKSSSSFQQLCLTRLLMPRHSELAGALAHWPFDGRTVFQGITSLELRTTGISFLLQRPGALDGIFDACPSLRRLGLAMPSIVMGPAPMTRAVKTSSPYLDDVYLVGKAGYLCQMLPAFRGVACVEVCVTETLPTDETTLVSSLLTGTGRVREVLYYETSKPSQTLVVQSGDYTRTLIRDVLDNLTMTALCDNGCLDTAETCTIADSLVCGGLREVRAIHAAHLTEITVVIPCMANLLWALHGPNTSSNWHCPALNTVCIAVPLGSALALLQPGTQSTLSVEDVVFLLGHILLFSPSRKLPRLQLKNVTLIFDKNDAENLDDIVLCTEILPVDPTWEPIPKLHSEGGFWSSSS
ncbi:hypothetical protein EXIGLDRAFT_721809 [Exidia glandulosa HHB12029]|uniref:F-box domain-containing protein n=1 Tax=Exidia glandulosa HHB12029 TaxID=1314781 RepID=A0A165QHF4_EXIGL|nr:hypothetical protein EXIGLDRAFT_721809 [Exidia glandulosa HHB12029]